MRLPSRPMSTTGGGTGDSVVTSTNPFIFNFLILYTSSVAGIIQFFLEIIKT